MSTKVSAVNNPVKARAMPNRTRSGLRPKNWRSLREVQSTAPAKAIITKIWKGGSLARKS